MTTIYNYNNSHCRIRPTSFRNRTWHKRTSWKRNFFLLENQWGRVKALIFPVGLLIALSCYWLMIFGSNISVDYKIYQLKTEINKSEQNNNLLREEASGIISNKEIEEWAYANNLVKADKIDYLSLENSNLAQAIQRNL